MPMMPTKKAGLMLREENKMSIYEEQARQFCQENNVEIKVNYAAHEFPPWEGAKEKVDQYRISLKRQFGDQRRSISFDFWTSIVDTAKNKIPTEYDILACISSDYYTPDTFEEFCANYGYDNDSIKAQNAFKRCLKFAKKLRTFFTESEAEKQQEIN